ncbi:hypothetical protein Tco_0127487 [Tanacetum coccineum]
MLLDMANLIKANRTLLNSKIFRHEEMSMRVLLAKERILKLIQVWDEKQIKPWSLPELLLQLSNDSQTIAEILKQREEKRIEREQAANLAVQKEEYLERSSKAITPDLPTEEPDNSLSMGDKHLDTILETELDEQLLYDDYASSDEDTFYSEDIDYVEASPLDSELVSLEEVKNFDTKDGEIDTDILLTIKDDILCEKLQNLNLLIAKIESLNDNPTPNFVLKSHSSFPIPVKDSDFFLEKSETFLSLPELETFRFDIEEKNSGSTTVHADISLSEYDSFHFKIEPYQGELTRVVVEDISDNSTRELYVYVPNVSPTLPTLEDRHYLFLTYVIRIFLPYFTYLVDSPFLLSSRNTSPKKKPVRATKGTRIKTKAKVGKSDKKKQPAKKPKANGLVVLSEVALTEAEQLKLATKRSKTYFHVSHTSGSSDGVDTQSKRVLDVPINESESEKESWGDSEEEDDNDDDGNNDDDDGESDDHDDDSDDERTESDRDEILDPNLTNVEQTEHEEEDVDDSTEYYEEEEEKIDDEETINDEEDDRQVEEDAHVLTPVLDTQKADEPVQSSFVSSDFTSKLQNLENPSPADNEIASLMETSARHAMAVPKITSGFTTTIPPPPPFFNPLPQQATPTPTPTTYEATTSFPSLPNFSSVFKFNDRVTNLEKDLSEIKQVDQYAQALSSIPTIVDRYIDNKLGEAINKAIQAYNLDCRQEAQDEKNESSSQPRSTYEAAAALFEFELTKILIDKIEKNKSYDKADHKRELYDALVKSYQTKKDLFDTYGKVFTLKRSRDDRDKDQDPSAGSDRRIKRRKSSKEAESSRDSSHTVDDSGVQQDQEFDTGNNDEQPANKEVSKDDCQVARAKEPRTSFDELIDTSFDFTAFVLNWLNIKDLTQEILNVPRPQLNDSTSITLKANHIRLILACLLRYFTLGSQTSTFLQKYDYSHLEEIEVHQEDQKLYKFREGDFPQLHLQDIEDIWIVIQRRVEDLQLGVDSNQKKQNLTKRDTFRSNLRNRTTYTAYLDPKGMIYKDQNNRNRFMRADELHKFSDGTLNDVQTALNDIAKGIRMEYLPKRKWSGLDKRRARVMVQDIDMQIY